MTTKTKTVKAWAIIKNTILLKGEVFPYEPGIFVYQTRIAAKDAHHDGWSRASDLCVVPVTITYQIPKKK